MYRLATSEPLFGAACRRQLAGRAVALMYHELASDNDDIEAWTVVRRSDFLRQMDYLRKQFDVVSLSQAIARMAQSNPADRPLVVITFDDGDRGNHDVLLPIVESMALPVTIFIATGQVQDQQLYWFDRLVNVLQTNMPITVSLPGTLPATYVINETRGARNWKAIENLLVDLKNLAPADRERAVEAVISHIGRRNQRSSGIAPLTVNDVSALASSSWVTIGGHSHCHNILTQIDNQAVAESVMQSKQLLELWAGRPIRYFAYPNGDYNQSVSAAVAAAGFEAAMTTQPRIWEQGEDIYALPRMGVGRYDSLDVFKAGLLGGIGRIFR